MKLTLRKPTRLQALLGLAGVSAVLAVTAQMMPRDGEADVVAPVERHRPAAAANAGAAANANTKRSENTVVAMLTPPDRGEVKTDAAGNPFRSSNWAPPPPPPPAPVVVAPAPPPPPKAPPVPYRFVGKLEAKNAAPRAFLAKGEALLIVSAGDLLDNLYKVESLGQTEVVLTYLPLNQRQSIPISGGQ